MPASCSATGSWRPVVTSSSPKRAASLTSSSASARGAENSRKWSSRGPGKKQGKEQGGGIFILQPVKPRCSPKLIIIRMIYAPGVERKQQSETVLIRRHLRKSSCGVRWKVLTGVKLLLCSSLWKANGSTAAQTGTFHCRQVQTASQ